MERPDLSIPTTTGDELSLEWSTLSEDGVAEEYYGILQAERAPVSYLVQILEELWRLNRYAVTFTILNQALGDNKNPSERLPLLAMKANYLLCMARKAPKLLLSRPRAGKPLAKSRDPNHPECLKDGEFDGPPMTKDEYWTLADQCIQEATRIKPDDKRVKDLQAIHHLLKAAHEPSLRHIEQILSTEPTNLMALTAKARILFAKRSFRPALRLYQTILTLNPQFLPDPRIGIGLCLWMLGEKERARKAWERSLEVNPISTSSTVSPLLLLALSHLHTSRDQTIPSDQVKMDAYAKGLAMLQESWRKDNTASAAASPLASHMSTLGNFDAATKLAERAVQFADARALLAEGHLQLARILHAQNDENAMVEYDSSRNVNPEQLIANLAVAQCLIRAGDIPAATNMFTTILRRHPRCIEALVSLASIHTQLAFTHKGVADSLSEKHKAKEFYEQILQIFDEGGSERSSRIKAAELNEGLWLEVGRLWEDDSSLSKIYRSYRLVERLQIEATTTTLTDPITLEVLEIEAGEASAEIVNNLGVIEFNNKEFVAARRRFELASTFVSKSKNPEAVLMAVTFNLGVTYEALGEYVKAQAECYDRILAKHPEFVDAKARLALMAMKTKSFDHAHTLIKEALTTQPVNPELRGLYAYFLHKTQSYQLALDFTMETLRLATKGLAHRTDVYALCAAGSLYYHQSRESRDPSKEAAKARSNGYLKAAEYYDKALRIDGNCAFAAQGLAISIAEGTLGTGVEPPGVNPLGEAGQKAKNSRDALLVLMKVKESVNEGSVYVNIGHCHFMKDEWERAIENYSTASKRYFKDRDLNTLLYLARAWYHKANHDHSFSDIQSALTTARTALALAPTDLAVIYNIAMILQKGLEIVQNLSQERRTLTELKEAIENCEESLALFQQLIDSKVEHPPYNIDLPRHRHRYGQNLLKKSPDLIILQTKFEEEEAARVAFAKQQRAAERERLAALEDEKLALLAKQAEQLAQQRKAIREETTMWTAGLKDDSEDEDKEKKRKGGTGKKRNKKAKKEDEESSGDDEDKPKTKRKKQNKAPKIKDDQMDVDGAEDSDEPVRAPKRKTGRGGKPFKSTEYVDSDSDSEGGDQRPKVDDDEEEGEARPTPPGAESGSDD